MYNKFAEIKVLALTVLPQGFIFAWQFEGLTLAGDVNRPGLRVWRSTNHCCLEQFVTLFWLLELCIVLCYSFILRLPNTFHSKTFYRHSQNLYQQVILQDKLSSTTLFTRIQVRVCEARFVTGGIIFFLTLDCYIFIARLINKYMYEKEIFFN